MNKTKKPNYIIIHGCPSNAEKAMNPETRTYDKHWIPWLKRELVSRGIKTETPLMPDPWEPVYEKFKAEFEKYTVDENSVLVGHSCGTAFLIHWLGETKTKVSKLILVSPWVVADKEDPYRVSFYEFPIDGTIGSRVGKIVMFTSDDDYEEAKESAEIVRQAIGGEVIELVGHGHFTMGHMGTEEFPELLEAVLK